MGPSVSCGDGLTTRRLRRLSQREYGNVVFDLLGTSARGAVMSSQDWPGEPRLGGFDNQHSALYVSEKMQEVLAGLAETLAAAANPTTLAPCATAAGSPACLQTFITTFVPKAYGRPLAADEVTRISAVAATGESYATSVRLVVELVLQSPHFVYISELGAPAAPAAPQRPLPLTAHEIASQLSFLLLGARPDDALMTAASSGVLATPDGLRAQVTRLMQGERARAELARFVTGWLDMGPIVEAPKSAAAFPELTPAIVSAMQQELDTFISTNLAGGQGTVSAFFTARSANVPAALAPIYGADLSAATGLNPDRRRGVLSLPGFLAFHATDHHSGPVERGLFVRQQLLCQPIPGPPPEVLQRIADNPINPDDKTRTTRQKFEMHLNEASCATCHVRFDPIGFGLEEMDGIGRYRTTENGQPVVNTGELSLSDVDGPFKGVAELSTKLAASKMVQSCMVDHFFRFAQARSAAAADRCVLTERAAEFTTGGGRIGDLVMAHVTHPTFTMRKDDR